MNTEMENEDSQPVINQQPTPETPPAVQEVPDESVAIPKKTFIVFPTVILLILVSLFAGYLLYQNHLLKRKIVKLTATPSPTATTNPIANWKTYTNARYGFEFKYPTSDVDQTIKKTIDNEDYFSITDNISFVIQKNSLKEPCDGICYSIYNGDHAVNGIQFSVAEGTSDDPGGREVCEEDCITQYVDNETEVATGVYAQIRSGSLPSKREETTNLVNQILSTFKFTDQQVKITDWKTYTNSKYSFSFQYPSSLSIDETIKNPESLANASLLQANPYLEFDVAVSEKIPSSCKNDVQPTKISVDNLPADKYEATGEGEAGNYTNKSVLIKKNNYYYCIFVGFGTEQVEFNTLFDKILSTFRFTD